MNYIVYIDLGKDPTAFYTPRYFSSLKDAESHHASLVEIMKDASAVKLCKLHKVPQFV